LATFIVAQDHPFADVHAHRRAWFANGEIKDVGVFVVVPSDVAANESHCASLRRLQHPPDFGVNSGHVRCPHLADFPDDPPLVHGAYLVDHND
jgi:hypothetical protein